MTALGPELAELPEYDGPPRQWSITEHRLVDIVEMLADLNHTMVQVHSKDAVPRPDPIERPNRPAQKKKRLSREQFDRLKPGRRHGN